VTRGVECATPQGGCTLRERAEEPDMTASDDDTVRVERADRRVRVLLGGLVVADTTAPRLVWERPYYPTYYLPAADVRTDLLVDTGEAHRSRSGEARVLTVKVGDREAASAARWYGDAPVPDLAHTVRFDWAAMDAWFEEDEEVFVHPRDPYKRVDVRQSSRDVRVEVDGLIVAHSRQPRFLFETGLPRRAYLPKTDVRLELLRPTATVTQCPYKGIARYYSLQVGDTTHADLAWWYQHTTLESAPIAGYICFYDERVDTFVDDILQDRPRTPFG
jgi:uncharacterized protein (DUF427 family)